MSYKLKILNGVLKLKTFSDVVLNILGIKDLGTQTGEVTDGYIDWSMQQYTQTTAEWNASTYILLKGQAGVEDTGTTTFKLKVGDGISTWQQLGYISGGGGNDFPEKLYLTVVNGTGANLLASQYKVVKVEAAQGQRLQVNLAQANNDNNSTDTIGIVYENINNNQTGKIIVVGEITGLNTTGSLQGETWNDGDTIYLSPTTAGKITNIKPTAPNHLVTLGYVVYAHQNNGKIYIKIDNGYELGELHNVYAPSPSNNQGIFWNSTNLRYENKSVNDLEKSSIQSFFFNTTVNPSDSITAFFGVGDAPSIYTKDSAAIIPMSGTIKATTISHAIFTSVGSNESSTFALRVYSGGLGGTFTDYNLTTSYVFTSTYNSQLINSLNITVNAGDAVEVKWITPVWVTNPLGVKLKSNIFIS